MSEVIVASLGTSVGAELSPEPSGHDSGSYQECLRAGFPQSQMLPPGRPPGCLGEEGPVTSWVAPLSLSLSCPFIL